MDSKLLLTAAISLLTAIAAFLGVFSARRYLTARMERDIAWADAMRQRVNPNAPGSRKMVMTVYAVAFCVLLPLMLLMFPSRLLAFGLWLLLWLIPSWLAEHHWQRHLRQIDMQLPACIRKFASLCGAGLSSAEAMQQLAIEAPMPIRNEFRIMANEWRMGADLPGVFRLTYQRLRLESFRLLTAAVTSNAELGGNLVQTLELLSGSLFTQWETSKEIDAAMAEGKMNIYGLLAAPPVMFGIICLCDMDAVRLFFTTNTGQLILIFALLIIAGGLAWALSIAKIRI